MSGTDTSCIILAGGLGTRLRGSIGDIPKCMAPVAGKPFLEYLLRYLEAQGAQNLVFSLGYRADIVLEWLAAHDWPFAISSVVEEEPLGTGGGIRLAMAQCRTASTFVMNGDTFFDVNLPAMHEDFVRCNAETLLALKAMRDFDRYGTVQLHPDDQTGKCRVLGFREKQQTARGLINGGVYCIDRDAFLAQEFPQQFSFEKDYLEASVGAGRIGGHRSDGYFIDIGVPEDFQRAQTDFQTLFPA